MLLRFLPPSTTLPLRLIAYNPAHKEGLLVYTVGELAKREHSISPMERSTG